MTEQLYHLDSYLREFPAVVTAVDTDAHTVTLDRTAFYPGGGGQPCDYGILRAGDTVYTVSKVEKGNLHVIAGDELPVVGDSVTGILDWERRYKLMRTHTAM